jgi:hypothetical protein
MIQFCFSSSLYPHMSFSIIRHYITLHYITLHYITLHYITLHYITLHYTTLHYTTLHYTTLHYTTLHYTTLHYTTLHYTTLHYTTLPYAEIKVEREVWRQILKSSAEIRPDKLVNPDGKYCKLQNKEKNFEIGRRVLFQHGKSCRHH